MDAVSTVRQSILQKYREQRAKLRKTFVREDLTEQDTTDHVQSSDQVYGSLSLVGMFHMGGFALPCRSVGGMMPCLDGRLLVDGEHHLARLQLLLADAFI